LKLISFRVTNFRSINDSGVISAAKVTTLVGRNESGKTNLLLGLHNLNPPGGPKDLSAIKDFPRHRRMSECKPDMPVVETVWELDAAEQARLAGLFPRAKSVTQVSIGRAYKAGNRWVGFVGLREIKFDHPDVLAQFQKLKAALVSASEKLEAGPKSQLDAAIATAESAVSKKVDANDWAVPAKPALLGLRQALTSTGAALALAEAEGKIAGDLEGLADGITADEKAHLEARKWLISRLPIFVYVDEYPNWKATKILTNTCIGRRAISGPQQT